MALLRDLRYAFRMLARDRSFTAVVIVALALGIGANSAVFTLVNAVLFKGLPFPHSSQLVVVNCDRPAKDEIRLGVSLPDYLDWQTQSRSFASLAALDFDHKAISDTNVAPQSFDAVLQSPNAFATLGAKPALGRDLLPSDSVPGAAPVVIVSDHVWRDVLGSDPHVVGRTVRLDNAPATVVGIMPPGFQFPLTQDLWMPLPPSPAAGSTGPDPRLQRGLLVFGRLRPGTGLSAARAEMHLVGQRLAGAYPTADAGVVPDVHTFNDEFNGGQIRIVFLALLGAVACVLFVACANVSNLLLARALGRGREIAVRAALGAGRARIVRQLLVESTLLGCLGGVAGLGLALAGVRAFSHAVSNVGKPYWIDFSMDFRAFGYLAGICLMTGTLFGLFPALHATRGTLSDTLKAGAPAAGGTRGAAFFTRALVVVELALSLLLLIGAGLMLRSFSSYYGLADRFPAARIVTAQIALPAAAYATPDARQRFSDALLTRLQSEPGISSVSVASRFPLNEAAQWGFSVGTVAPADPSREPYARVVLISPAYFRTLAQPLLRGRVFDDHDGQPGAMSLIVNQRFAAKYFPHTDPLRQAILLSPPALAAQTPTPAPIPMTVVGIAPDIRQDSLAGGEPEPTLYLPARVLPLTGLNIMAQSASPSTALPNEVRSAVQALDGTLAVNQVMSLDDRFRQQSWPYRVFGTLFTVFAGFGLLLAAIGLYSVVAYSVARRTREIGIRMALGGSRGNILRMIAKEGASQILIGLAVGLAAALGATRVLTQLLIGVTATDPATFAALAALLAAIAFAACVIPALRAAAVDPNVALRYE